MDDAIARLRQHRDDDGQRLVHADALQSAGDPRGEFIAVQCELQRLGLGRRTPSWDWIGDALVDFDAIDAKKLRTLRAREKALLDEHEQRWASAALRVVRKVTFERGFISRAAFETDGVTDGAVRALYDAAPLLEALTVRQPQLEVFFEPADQLRELVVPAIGALALSSEDQTALTRLHLQGQPTFDSEALEQEGLRTLLDRWPRMAALTHLTLTQLELDEAKVKQLLTVVGPLLHLELRQNALGPAGARLLAASSKLASLRVLSVLGNALGPKGTTSLAEAPTLQRLEALDLRRNSLGVDGARAVGNAFPELRVLDLTGNSLGHAGLSALTSGKGLGGLRDLCLQQTSLDDEALEVLAAAPLLAHVRVLNLRSNKITDAGAKALAKSRYAKKLVQVNLNNNQVTPAGKKALAESEHLPVARILA